MVSQVKKGGQHILFVCDRCFIEEKRQSALKGEYFLPLDWVGWYSEGNRHKLSLPDKLLCPECNEAVWKPIPQAIPEERMIPFNAPEYVNQGSG